MIQKCRDNFLYAKLLPKYECKIDNALIIRTFQLWFTSTNQEYKIYSAKMMKMYSQISKARILSDIIIEQTVSDFYRCERMLSYAWRFQLYNDLFQCSLQQCFWHFRKLVLIWKIDNFSRLSTNKWERFLSKLSQHRSKTFLCGYFLPFM